MSVWRPSAWPESAGQRSADLPGRLLLISCSSRMLAQSARRAGIRTVALDHYADADTQASADSAQAIPCRNGEFDGGALLEFAARIAPAIDYPLVYGSGLDAQPALLEELTLTRALIGNPPALHRLFREPLRFFGLLERLGIAYPESRFERPSGGEAWLIKSGCSEGGKRVRFSAHDVAGAGEYYQRWLPGPAYSALFLADGQRSAIIGFNTLWSLSRARQPCLFAGAINHAPMNAAQRQQVARQVAGIVAASQLRGLNSLDFMLDRHGAPQVLEINARPSATLALYDGDYPEGLLAAHIRACRGALPERIPVARFRAFRVLFAPAPMAVTPAIAWPAGCADLPTSGTVVQRGQPLCTLTAEGMTLAALYALLERRTAELLRFCAGVR